jgi:hypothetical protein
VRTLWARIAVSALTAVRPFVRMSDEQGKAWQTVIDLLRML